MLKKSTPPETDYDVHQPHDKVVKQFLNDPSQVKDFLIAYLSKDLLAQIDLNYLKLQPNHYIDHTQHAYSVDVLYKTKINDENAYLWRRIQIRSATRRERDGQIL